jgi:hypothetical protein
MLLGYTGVMGQPPMPQIFTKWQQRTIPKGRVLVDRALPCGNILGWTGDGLLLPLGLNTPRHATRGSEVPSYT